ncbi:cysteine hydrolase family protein [Tepidanaerobacter syntrophicus]|uniref:cysteine hydrolase family protein n=1 Tax=Tepidanaerobacter syntrophicus TaxID=224999 RepID=UPI001BD2709E|nr:isochorismatase family cysteine hydrolase [Tepidanaerobacter syntrophicus]
MKDTALLIIDMVKDFTNPNGAVFYPQNRKILPKIRTIINKCREKDILIIFLRHSYRKNKYDKNLVNMRPNCIEGTGGDEIDEMLPVDEEKDYVIKKRRYSGFFGTDLDLVLRENNIKNVIITGTKTNCCIRATVADAYYLNYNVYVISDCVATNDEIVNQIYLTDISKYFGHVITSEELFELVEKGELE